MDKTRAQLNSFLVEAFHSVLRAEERYLRSLGYGDLSISEMHVIEASLAAASEGRPSLSGIAQALRITPGSLSIAVSVLEKKGYLKRERDQSDRRRILITPTAKGRKAEAAHRQVHERMIDEVLAGLSPAQADTLASALKRLQQFFTEERTFHP